jgi:uncharacterized OB-fold protein
VSPSQQVPLAEGLFTVSGQPQLMASRCRDCGVHTFPRQDGCPRCSGTTMEDVLLPPAGKLWTWTTQGFRPKTPPYLGPEGDDDFTPFLLGYVEFPGQLKVEGRLVGVDPDQVRIGQSMDVVLVPFREDGDSEVVTFAFRPSDGAR